MDGVYQVLDSEGELVTDVGSCHEFYQDFFELKVIMIDTSGNESQSVYEPAVATPSCLVV